MSSKYNNVIMTGTIFLLRNSEDFGFATNGAGKQNTGRYYGMSSLYCDDIVT